MNLSVRHSWCFLVLAMLCIFCNNSVIGDGEPSGFLDNSGIIVPDSDCMVHILDQTVEITCPNINRYARPVGPTHIRVTYHLSHDSDSRVSVPKDPLHLQIAWPTGMGEKEYPVYVKLDDKPIASEYVTYSDLCGQYFDTWLAQIDSLLTAKPELKKEVLSLRPARSYISENEERTYIGIIPQPGTPDSPSKMAPSDLVKKLTDWMKAHSYFQNIKQSEVDNIACGLLGIGSMNYRDLNLSRASSEQNALKWLDPIYTPIDLDNTLHERWDYQSLLLDPWSEYLDDIEGSTLGDIHDPYFGIIRFPITLEPMKKQTLIVDYLQDLSWTGKTKNDSFCGLVYIMEPAQRWGIWEQTTIQIHIPTGMKKVAIRPRPSNITHSKKMTTYTIKMGRPYENLYVSLVP